MTNEKLCCDPEHALLLKETGLMEGVVEVKIISGYDKYFAGTDGNIYSTQVTRFNPGGLLYKLNPVIRRGYRKVDLCNEQKKSKRVCRLIAEAFVYNPDPDNKTQVNHIDGNKLNDAVSNLEWNTPKENQRHASINGLASRTHGYPMTPVIQIDNTGIIIAKYDSIASAAKATGILATSINNHLKRRSKQAGGYKWKHV